MNKIPKIIHYCWFGRSVLPQKAKQCIASWKKHCPDYELKLWNEETFDVTSIRYTKESYEAKKYAFTTDYVRLFALKKFGGIYMDVDVEVIKNLDPLLSYHAFSGFESERYVSIGTIGSMKGSPLINELLSIYKDRTFLLPNGKPDLTTNVQLVTTHLVSNGFTPKDSYQVYKECFHIFPKDYFVAKSRSGIITTTANTYCIHHYHGSWNTRQEKLKKFFFEKIIGPKNTDRLVSIKKKVRSKK